MNKIGSIFKKANTPSNSNPLCMSGCCNVGMACRDNPNLINHGMKEEIAWQQIRGSGCGTVGRAVTSDSRGQGIDSSQRQTFVFNIRLFL